MKQFTVRHSYSNGRKDFYSFELLNEAIEAANSITSDEENPGCSDILDEFGEFLLGRKWNEPAIPKQEDDEQPEPGEKLQTETSTPEDAFKTRQEGELFAKLAAMTKEQLETALADFVFTAHGSFLEEDYEGDSDTLGSFYSLIEEYGLRPEGNLGDIEESQA